MPPEKDSILKIIVGFSLIIITLIAIKQFMLPLVHDLSLSDILTLSMLDILKVFESIMMLLLLAGFVLQEIEHVATKIVKAENQSHNDNSRWSELIFVFSGAFGSAALYFAIQMMELKNQL